jgi:uncharacterized OB-fold protein
VPSADELRGVLPPEVVSIMANVWTEPFWAAAQEHRLVLPRCTTCAAMRFPPGPFCHQCRAQEVEWIEHDGRGEIYSFTVIRHAVIPDVKAALPLVAAVVELRDGGGVRVIGNIVDVDVDDDPTAVAIGRPVEIDWYDVRADTTVPVFRLASA